MTNIVLNKVCRWELVAIVVLACQGFIFERSDESSSIFTIFVMILLCGCFLIVLKRRIFERLKNKTNEKVVVPVTFAKQELWPGLLMEVYQTNSYSKIERDQELELDVAEILKGASTCRLPEVSTEYSNIKNVISGLSDKKGTGYSALSQKEF
jgi:hypothetical protein